MRARAHTHEYAKYISEQQDYLKTFQEERQLNLKDQESEWLYTSSLQPRKLEDNGSRLETRRQKQIFSDLECYTSPNYRLCEGAGIVT